ncbi:conserved Plasmodium protein, unknown function [Plasmodium malariae]|uniref:Translational activator GCN1 n=2 Tax=Plasmodium malariae TaxID=5858 RepID=A0A1D3TE30_PLAMA|nr:conserved Plasmodium protein, unknown function [Plasmodium malariae]SCP03166.1 conserved Plasmodium protein, unknown function [Plasmodium malariae]
MYNETNNMEDIREFIYLKKEKAKREHIELVKNNIEDILNEDDEEAFELIDLLFFTKETNYIKNNMCICIHLLSHLINEINREKIKENLYKYILKRSDEVGFSYFERAFFCKKILCFCSEYDNLLSDLQFVSPFRQLFMKCVSFLDDIFYSNEKFNEVNHKLRMLKKGIINKLILIYSNISNMKNRDKYQEEEGNIPSEEAELEYLLNICTEETPLYLVVESFGLYLCTINQTCALYRKKMIDRFTNIFINILNTNKEILLKITRSFKYFFQICKDENMFTVILNLIHRYDEVALRNAASFYYYSELYNQKYLYNVLDIVINIKKTKNIESCDLLYFIIFYKFHLNNDNDCILKMLFENYKKLNAIKFNEKIIFLRCATYLLSSYKSKEIKNTITSNEAMITNYLKNDLNEDVKIESLKFVRRISSIFKNDKDIYNIFSKNILELLEKYGKNNDTFLYFCILYYIDLVSVLEVNEKLLSILKSHINFCLTKQVLKHVYGVNLFLFLYIKCTHPSVKNIDNQINEILLKSIYNKDELFYLYDINEISKIPLDKFFFYVYSLLLLLQFLMNEDNKMVYDYLNSLNKDFSSSICFDKIGKIHIEHVLLSESGKREKKKTGTNLYHHNKVEHTNKIEGRKNKLDNLHMLTFLIILCILHYLQEKKYDNAEFRKKNQKTFQNYVLSLKKGGILNGHICEYQNYVDDFHILLDVLLMQKEIFQLILYSFYIYLFIYWNNSRYHYGNKFILRKFTFFLFSYVNKVYLDPNEKQNCYVLFMVCFCHPSLFYKNLRNSVSRRRMKNFICKELLTNINLEVVIAFVLKGSDYYDSTLHKNVCIHLVETFYILKNVGNSQKECEAEQEDISNSRHNELRKDMQKIKREGISALVVNKKKNCIEKKGCIKISKRQELTSINNVNIKEQLISFTSKLIEMLDDKSVENIKEEEIEICKSPYDTLYVDRNVYQPTVVVESKNIKRNKHLFSMYDEETAELIMEEELNKSRKTNNRSTTKDKKHNNKNKGMTKEDLEMEEIKKQNEIRIRIYEIFERNKYLLKCIKLMSYIRDIFDMKYVNIFIKKIMIFLKNDLTTRFAQKYLYIIIDNMISTKLLSCKNKITRCLYKISKYNKVGGSALMIFSSFNMNEKITYVLTLFLIPIVFHSINIINDKDATLNILKTLDILLHTKTQINDEDALKCLQISFEKYPDIDVELESFLDNFNSYLLNKKNIRALLELCITQNEKRRNVIIKSLYKYVMGDEQQKEKEKNNFDIFKNESIYTYINIFKNDYNKETQKYCEEIIRKLNIPCVTDQYMLIDSLQKECCDFQDMICKSIVVSTNKHKTKELIFQLTSKYITFKEYGKIGILKTMEKLAKSYYITVIDDVEFVLNFLLGLCLEEKSDITKIKEYVIICGTSLINSYNEYLVMSKKRKKKKEKRNMNVGRNNAVGSAKGKKELTTNSHSNQFSDEDFSEEDDESLDPSSDSIYGECNKGNAKTKNENKDLEEGFKRIYNVLNKYRDNKKSKNKNMVDLIVVMFYGCLGPNLKKELLELLNKLIEQILHKDTDNFTQIEISTIIPKFIENLKNGNKHDSEDEEVGEEAHPTHLGYNQMKTNVSNSLHRKKNVTFDINEKNQDSTKSTKKGNKNKSDTTSSSDRKKGDEQEGHKKNKKKINGDKGNKTDSLIYLESYDVSVFVEDIFSIIFTNKELKIRKGCCLLLGSVVKAHGMAILKKYNILDKINSNIDSEDVIKRQSFYLAYGSLFKVLKIRFEPYILNNFKLLLECYKDNVNNIKVLGISIIEEILNDISQYALKKILPFIVDNLTNSSIKNKDIISYLETLHIIISKFDILNYIDNNALMNLINTLCELVTETNAKVKEICIKIFNKLEKMINNNDMKNISRQLLSCIYSPNNNNLSAFLDIFSSISFEYKIDNISLCLILPVIKTGINNIRLEIRKKSLQIFYFLIYLVSDPSLFIIYYDSIFEILIHLLNDAIPEIRYLTAKSIGNICQFMDINNKLFYIQHIFNILINAVSSVEKSGVSLCLSSILSKCSEKIANIFISKVVKLIDVKKYNEIKNEAGKKIKQIDDSISKFDGSIIKGNKKKGSKQRGKSNGNGEKHVKFIDDDEEEVENYYSDDERESEGENEDENESRAKEYSINADDDDFDSDADYDDITGSDDYNESDDDEADYDDYDEQNNADSEESGAEKHGTKKGKGNNDAYKDKYKEIKKGYDEEDRNEENEDEEEDGEAYTEDEEDEEEEMTEEDSDSDSDYELMEKNSERKSHFLNGNYLIEKDKSKNEYCKKIDDDLINWKLKYDKKIIKNGNSKEGLIGFFIYMPECEPNYTEKFLKKIFQKLLLCLNDSDEKIRDITLRACKVLITVYSKNNTSLILKFIENKIYNGYWRIRRDSVSLLNILIEKNLEIHKEEKDIEILHALHERFYFMLSLICIMKNDTNINVRQISYNIYKNYVNKRVLQEMWPILLKKITQNLSSKNNSKQVISALTLGDLVFKTDSNSLKSILENLINDFKTTKNISIRKGIALGFYEIFSKNKFNNLIVNQINDIIFMIKELAYHRNTSDIIKLLSSLLLNIEETVMKDVILEIINHIISSKLSKNGKKFTLKQLMYFKSIKLLLHAHTELVIDIIVDNALIPPYTASKLKLLSYVSYAKLGVYTHLFSKITNIFINLIYSSSKNLKDSGHNAKKDFTAEEDVYDDDNDEDDEGHDCDKRKWENLELYKTDMQIEDIILYVKCFLKNINEKNIDILTDILFSELKKCHSKINLSYATLEKYRNENGKDKTEDKFLITNYSKIMDKNKLKKLRKFEYFKGSGKIREIILSIFKYLLDVINEGDISLLNNERTTISKDKNTTDLGNSINMKKKIKKKINLLNVNRIDRYLNFLSNYTLVDINIEVLEISSLIYMYLIEMARKLDSKYTFVYTFHSIINKYTTDSNLNEIPEDKYEIVGLNVCERLFSSFINIFTDVILLSTNSDIKIKSIEILRKLFLYTNSEITNPFILKISGILIRVLTNKYIEQAKIFIFSTFEILIKKGSNHIKPLVPQLQTCIIKSLNNDKLKNQIIHILNIISEKKLSRVDLLVNDLLNNINIQINLQQSVTILMILSNILNNSDVNLKNILNKIINLIKPLFDHSNNDVRFYSCKIYVLLIIFHLPGKKQYLESVLYVKPTLDVTSYYFMLHISEVSNFYDILKKENSLDAFKQLYEQMLKEEINSLQNICYNIFYNLSKCDDDCISYIYSIISYLKLPPLIMISKEIHQNYFKGIKHIFNKKPDIYHENIPNFLIILDNVLLALTNTGQVFKLMGESCLKCILEVNDENRYKMKIKFLKDKMESKKYNQLLEFANSVLAKKRSTTFESE